MPTSRTACWVQGVGLEAGGPHRQRAARFFQAVVDPFAISGQFGEGVVVELIDFVVEIEIEPGAAEEAVGFEQLVFIGNLLGRAAAGHGPGEEHLRRPVEGVQKPQSIQRTAPTGGRDVRHAVFVPGDRKSPPGMFEVEWFHARRGFIDSVRLVRREIGRSSHAR